MQLDQIRQQLKRLGAGPGHQAHVLRRWVQARPQHSGRRRIEHYLPLALRESLRPIAASAGTVIATMLVLLLAELESTHWLGPVLAIGIAAALVGVAVARLVIAPRRERRDAAAHEE